MGIQPATPSGLTGDVAYLNAMLVGHLFDNYDAADEDKDREEDEDGECNDGGQPICLS
jgi:hypothetical protein